MLGNPELMGVGRAPEALAANPEEAPHTEMFTVPLETLAWQGLNELATALVPGRPLETAGDVARFVTQLHVSLETFCRCFVALRDGLAQLGSVLERESSPAELASGG